MNGKEYLEAIEESQRKFHKAAAPLFKKLCESYDTDREVKLESERPKYEINKIKSTIDDLVPVMEKVTGTPCGDAIVNMVIYQGRPIISTESSVYLMGEDNVMRLIKFESDES